MREKKKAFLNNTSWASIYVCKAHIPKNTMRYKGIARYSFFGYLSIYIKIYMVEIITNNTRVLLVFFLYFSFCFCFFPVSLHCINSSRGKNNRGCSLWEKEKEEQQKIASHSNTMRTRQPRVNKKNNMRISRIWFADKNGWKRSETVQKPGQYPSFIDFSSFEMAFFLSPILELKWCNYCESRARLSGFRFDQFGHKPCELKCLLASWMY